MDVTTLKFHVYAHVWLLLLFQVSV